MNVQKPMNHCSENSEKYTRNFPLFCILCILMNLFYFLDKMEDKKVLTACYVQLNALACDVFILVATNTVILLSGQTSL